MNWGTSVLWRDYYCRKLSKSLIPWHRINGIADFSNVGQLPILWKQQHLSCRTSSVIALSGVNFGHHGPKFIHHLTSLCGDFYSSNLGSQVNLKHNIEQAVAGINQPTLWKVAERTVKRVKCSSSKRWADIFSTCCSDTSFMTSLMSLKKMEIKIK